MEGLYVDIPRLYTALAEWSACLVYILTFPGKSKGVKRYVTWAGALVVQCAWLYFTGRLDKLFWIPCMLGAAGLMYAFLYVELKVSARAACFVCAKAFLFAEFAASLEWQVHVFLFSNRIRSYHWNQLLFMAAGYLLLSLLLYVMEKNRITEEYAAHITKKECVLAVSIAAISFAVSNLSFVFSNTPFTSSVQTDIFNIRTLVDLCGMVTLFFLQSQILELLAEKELTSIHGALKSQYEQYRNYQESFEMMNMKYHDIKHQIDGLRAEKDAGKQEEWLKEMEKELDVFGELGHTGSHVLDGILAAKNIYCKKHHIKVTCVADGSILQTIHVADLCTIFGNAFDNAIESVSLIQDEKKRLIHLSVSKKKNFIFIQMENYCEGDLQIGRNQLPMTSKSNQKEHGYGMRSMKQSVEKYGGSMAYRLENGWFELKILIPYRE